MNRYAFWKGWGLLRSIDQPKVKEEIMSSLCITTRNGFYNRRRGEVSHNDAEKETIENIFKKYGIPANSVWGE